MNAKCSSTFRSYIQWDTPLMNGDVELSMNDAPHLADSDTGPVLMDDGELPPNIPPPPPVSSPAALTPPAMLPGETLVASCCPVLVWHQQDRYQSPSYGAVHVTNFKLTFSTDSTNTSTVNESCPRPAPVTDLGGSDWSSLVSANQLCLANIDHLFQLVSIPGRRRRATKLLTPHSHVAAGKIKTLLIRCKDFRVFNMGFAEAAVERVRAVVNALLIYTYPRVSHLLFAFDYSGVSHQHSRSMTSSRGVTAGGVTRCLTSAVSHQYDFSTAADWQKELKRTGAAGWRLSHVNSGFCISDTLPEFLVVPRCVSDADIERTSTAFVDNRLPVWCWSSPGGASICRSAKTLPSARDSECERLYLEAVGRCHPGAGECLLLDLSNRCVSVADLHTSYCRLRQLCVPESRQAMVDSEYRWLSLLSETRWPHAVVQMLSLANHCVSLLSDKNTSIVLSEPSGRDMSAVLSSLIQLLMDARCRTIAGFQRLIDKEWLALAHPFQSRHGLVQSSAEQRSAVFLLFLDCVHQLVVQFPAEFQFGQVYLVTVWDSCLMPSFDTFIFDCQKDRYNATRDSEYSVKNRSVWNWGEQFSPDDQQLFLSPLYQLVYDPDLSDLRHSTVRTASQPPLPFPRTVAATKPVLTTARGYSLLAHVTAPAAGSPAAAVPPAAVASSRLSCLNSCAAGSGLSSPLQPLTSLSAFRLWTLCYCRWLPDLNVSSGGDAAVCAQLRHLLAQLCRLRLQLKTVSAGVDVRSSRYSSTTIPCSVDLPCSFYPFSSTVAGVHSRLLCVGASSGLMGTLVRHSIAPPAGYGSSDRLSELW